MVHAEVFRAASHLLVMLERNLCYLLGTSGFQQLWLIRDLGGGLFSKCLSESVTLAWSFHSVPVDNSNTSVHRNPIMQEKSGQIFIHSAHFGKCAFTPLSFLLSFIGNDPDGRILCQMLNILEAVLHRHACLAGC